MLIAVIIVLFIGFRSFRVIPVLLFPLAIGLIWALALVPLIVKELNTITSFLIQVAFGLGIDFSIHIVKRYQKELNKKSSFDALIATYLTTGRSVLLSGLTTSLALLVLIISDFRGISEFGLVGGVSLLMILIAMFLVMPSVITLGYRIGLLKKQKREKKTIVILNPLFTIFVLIIICGSAILALFQLKFDFDFNNLESNKAEPPLIKKKQDQVYADSYAPSAIYVVPDLSQLDLLVSYFKEEKKKNPDTKIGWIRSIRDFCPDEAEISRRIELLFEIKKNLTKRWVNRIRDPQRIAWIESIKNWHPSSHGPEITELPHILKKHFMSKNNSNQYLVSIFSNTNRKDGKKAIEFSKEINSINTPENIPGPVGGTLVFAEILWLVTSEGPWLIMMTFLAVMVLIFINQRSLGDTLWILLPLISGMILTVGIMSFLDLKINFFNIVVLPALLGMGVDDGIHYYRLWKENKRDIKSTQKTLFGPLSITTLTTMLGYAGMVFAHHPGLHSIGLLACIGLTCTWFTSLFLFPNILNYFQKRKT
jgi:predicted RND superfamily exporter protein